MRSRAYVTTGALQDARVDDPSEPRPRAVSPESEHSKEAPSSGGVSLSDPDLSGSEGFRFEIALSDQELATAWVREHYGRQGSLRFWMAPLLVLLGTVLLAQATGAPRIAAVLMIVWGFFAIARPFLMASQIVAQRRKRGGTQKVELTIEGKGLTVTKDGKGVLFPWKDITAAGMRKDYVWYEIRGAQRAPIPKRVIADVDALQRFFAKRTLWSKS
jgi:hypothetical protein